MTSIPTANPNLMQHKIIRTGEGWGQHCNCCGKEIDIGEDRHEWRMQLTSRKFHNGMFWTTNCHECFVKTVISWRDTLTEEIEAMPEYMRELA